MKLSTLYEADFPSRQLERRAVAGDEEARQQLLRRILRGQYSNIEPYPQRQTSGKPIGGPVEKAREIASQNQEWRLLYQLEYNNKLVQQFDVYWGSLEDAMEHADQEMVSRFEQFGITAGTDPVGVFQGAWMPNYSYGQNVVFSRGFGHDGSLDYAVAYVGEPGWGD